jgi:hypothetical protein
VYDRRHHRQRRRGNGQHHIGSGGLNELNELDDVDDHRDRARGSSGDDGGTCAVGSNPTACATCAFTMCKDTFCTCDASALCKGARGDYFTCLGGLDGGDMESCAADFDVGAAADASKADLLAQCMGDKCLDACK